MGRIDGVILNFSLQDLNSSLTSGDKDRAAQAFRAKVRDVNDQIEREKQEQLEKVRKTTGQRESGSGSGKREWKEDELQMLIKGVGLFPAGTVQR